MQTDDDEKEQAKCWTHGTFLTWCGILLQVFRILWRRKRTHTLLLYKQAKIFEDYRDEWIDSRYHQNPRIVDVIRPHRDMILKAPARVQITFRHEMLIALVFPRSGPYRPCFDSSG